MKVETIVGRLHEVHGCSVARFSFFIFHQLVSICFICNNACVAVANLR